MSQLLAGLWRQRRLTRLMGEALCCLLSLTQSAQSVILLALEFGRREAIGRVDVFVAAPIGDVHAVSTEATRGQPLQ
jgi:hypothetical protein